MTSTEQEDIQEFVGELRSVSRDNGLILVNEAKFALELDRKSF
jgi:hypothetical protein